MSLSKKEKLHVVQAPINCGTFKLPAGIETANGILSVILMHLDLKSLLKVLESSLIKQLCTAFDSCDFLELRQEAMAFNYAGRRRIMEIIYVLKQLYKVSKQYLFIHDERPIVCFYGFYRTIWCNFRNDSLDIHEEDLTQFVNLYGFHAYIEDVIFDGFMKGDIRKDFETSFISTVCSTYCREHITHLELFLQHVDIGVTDVSGSNVLHHILRGSEIYGDATLAEYLLNKMKLKDINCKNVYGVTPLDFCLMSRGSFREKVLPLIREAGGKSGVGPDGRREIFRRVKAWWETRHQERMERMEERSALADPERRNMKTSTDI